MERLNSIGFEWASEAAWEEKFQLLVDYQKEHGTTRVSRSTHPVLGHWVKHQRALYNRKTLTEYRLKRLNSIGFKWQIYSDSWMEMYHQLICYKRQHNGSTNVPRGWTENSKLACWVYKQRITFSKGDLSQKRIDKLESIGFKWDPQYEQWMEMYQRLVEYNKKYGTTCVPKKWKKDPKLGKWVCAQRTYCKEQYRIDLLNRICFVWDASNVLFHERWMEMYRRLVRYNEKYGTTCVPTKWKKDPKLANWVVTQRMNCKEQYRIDLLNRIGFIWDATGIKAGQVPTMQIRL